MLEKLRDNPRVVVAALVAAGVLAVAIGAGGNNKTDETSQQQETTSSDTAQNETPENQTETSPQSPTPAPIDTKPPVAGPVQVTSQEGQLKATVRKGDNQTVIVRQIIADHLRAKNENISAEQRLYAETNIVNQLPRNDLIYAGQELSVSEETVAKIVSGSKQLTPEAIKRWSQYL